MKRAIKLVLYYFAYQLVFALLAGLPAILMKAVNGTLGSGSMAYGAGSSMTGIVMVLSGAAMIWHLLHFKYVNFNRKRLTEVPMKALLSSVPFVVAAMFLFNVGTEFMELPNRMENIFMEMSRNVFGIVSIVVMAPMVEELLFRGAIEGHLLQTGKKPKTAIFLSALIFGIIHVNPAQIPFAFCLGLVFGWLYYRTGSVIPGMIGHFLNNAMATAIMAVSTEEEMSRKTIDMIGTMPTCLLLLSAAVVFVGMSFYLDKQLPRPDTSSGVADAQA